jgi:hypothetical protein
MATKYHIGDMFRVPRKKIIAVIVGVENDGGNNEYSLRYLDLETHEPVSSPDGYYMSWWNNYELEKKFKPIRVFGM